MRPAAVRGARKQLEKSVGRARSPVAEKRNARHRAPAMAALPLVASAKRGLATVSAHPSGCREAPPGRRSRRGAPCRRRTFSPPPRSAPNAATGARRCGEARRAGGDARPRASGGSAVSGTSRRPVTWRVLRAIAAPMRSRFGRSPRGWPSASTGVTFCIRAARRAHSADGAHACTSRR